MYTDFTRLWKLLVERNMTKTDLMEITGLSSRIIAKLSKNETVTTETVARICEALNCNVGDIMECVSDRNMSFQETFRRLGKIVDETELYRTVEFVFGGQKYVIYETKNRATKGTHIECRPNGTVYWVQLYMFGGLSTPSRVESVLIKPKRRSDEIVIVLIKGKPGNITGLDNGIFVSAARGGLKKKTGIYVMSESAFKQFTSQQKPGGEQ